MRRLCPYCEASNDVGHLKFGDPKTETLCEECGLVFIVKITARGWPQVWELGHERHRHNARLKTAHDEHLEMFREVLGALEAFVDRHEIIYDLQRYLDEA